MCQVNNEELWPEVQDKLGITKACGNIDYGLRQIYIRLVLLLTSIIHYAAFLRGGCITEWCYLSVCPSVCHSILFGPVSPDQNLIETSDFKVVSPSCGHPCFQAERGIQTHCSF